MKKLFLGLIVIVMMVCLINPVPSTAADIVKSDIVKVIGEVTYGPDENAKENNLRRVPGDLNYSKEAYTTGPPSSGEQYNAYAESIFYPGENIYLIDRYYMGNAGSYTKYFFITDVVGTVVYFGSSNKTSSGFGGKVAQKTITISKTGSYIFYTITLGLDESLTSKRFTFTVE
jgi:hypothetical protein